MTVYCWTLELLRIALYQVLLHLPRNTVFKFTRDLDTTDNFETDKPKIILLSCQAVSILTTLLIMNQGFKSSLKCKTVY